MIAIDVGLFLGAGGKLHQVGPPLVFSYAICGVAAYFVMRALGELVLHGPSSGSFVTYARRSIGPWAGFAEITAVAIYVHK